ncbi:hypothetical protein Pmani_026113 [Petrolisthes manimaculis]|uniref:Uncharacterized protein n=1 Tax=Petrolisthes manimaculis TaxID=1843537 RepID=A0AAE1TY58_9EUCA|nr:hypothetical protein Pmani_026113 [Petrolisthes manimaculis]
MIGVGVHGGSERDGGRKNEGGHEDRQKSMDIIVGHTYYACNTSVLQMLATLAGVMLAALVWTRRPVDMNLTEKTSDDCGRSRRSY